MGRRRTDRPSKEALPPLCARIEWLLRHLWRNSITDMAREIGVSHPALSRVVAGQLPSGKMLEGLARRADVDTHWLLTGEGEPRVDPARSIGVLCPLAIALVPGKSSEHPELFTTVTLPAASPFALRGAYWVRVGGADPVVTAGGREVNAGDYLLVESDERWTRRPEAYAGRLLALLRPAGGVLLADCRLHREAGEAVPQHELKTFGLFGEARLFPGLTRQAAAGRPPASDFAGPELVRFYADDVVGVVLQLARFLARSVV